jgi:NAD+ diphosphatase
VTPRFCLLCAARLRRRLESGRPRFVCGRCGFTHYGNPVPAAGAILMKSGAVLLGRRAAPPHAGTWDVPGGFLEAGETAEQALRRELREELGIRVGRLKLVGLYADRYGKGGIPLLSIIYRGAPGDDHIVAADDVSEVRWFPLERLPFGQIAFRSIRAALREVRDT